MLRLVDGREEWTKNKENSLSVDARVGSDTLDAWQEAQNYSLITVSALPFKRFDSIV